MQPDAPIFDALLAEQSEATITVVLDPRPKWSIEDFIAQNASV